MKTLLYLALAFAVASAASPEVHVVVCVPVQSTFLPSPLHARFAVDYYAPQFKNTAFSTKLIGQWEGATTTARGIASAFAINGTGCDIVIGPATSTFALALNALVDSMWLSYGASSTQLSDRVNYPLFSRTVPSDAKDARGVVAVLVKFGWLQANALCADTPNGQSLVQGMRELYGPQGGALLSSDCMSATSTLADVRAQLQNFLNSDTRAVFVAAASDVVYTNFIAALSEPAVAGAFAVVFGSSLCSAADGEWRSVPGAICATFAFDNQPYRNFRTAYLQRDMTADRQSFAEMNWPVATTDLTTADAYCPLAIDAARIAMYAMDTYVGKYGVKPNSAATAVAWLRNQTLTDGITGAVTLPTGDRDACDMGIFNMGPDNTTYRLGNLTAAGNLTTVPQVYLLGQWWDAEHVPPVSAMPSLGTHQPYWVIAVVVIPLLMAAIVAYGFRFKGFFSLRPLDGSKPFGVMFVRVKNISELHDLGEDVSIDVRAKLAQIVRKAARRSRCYVARDVDEATVMITAKRAKDIIACAVEIARVVALSVAWDTVVELDVAAYDHRRRQFSKRSCSTQPRLQIGAHFGPGDIDYNSRANTVAYHGAAVVRAASVTDAAGGDEILVSRELLTVLRDAGDVRVIRSQLGRFGSSAAGESAVKFVPHWMEPGAAFVTTTGVEVVMAATDTIPHINELPATLVAMVIVEVPWLAEVRGADESTRVVQLCDELEEVASRHQGEVHSYGDREILFTVMKESAESPIAVRAVSLAWECVQHCAQLRFAASAGVAVSTCLFGRRHGSTAAFGTSIGTARAAQQHAKAASVPVVLAEAGYDDVASRFHIMTIGVAVLPSGNIGRMVAINAARDTQAEGEWLYVVPDTSVCSKLIANERAWECIRNGATPPSELLTVLTKDDLGTSGSGARDEGLPTAVAALLDASSKRLNELGAARAELSMLPACPLCERP